MRLGLDIGGANLKAATSDRRAMSLSFALWRDPGGLASALRRLAEPSLAGVDSLAVTMTGELADCYVDKAEGVRSIAQAVATAFPGLPTRVYRVDGRFASLAETLADPRPAAASNWRALAQWASRFASHGAALLIDVGSTTCDVIPLVDGVPAAQGDSDPTRLQHGELLYTGVERSPVCGVIQDAPYRERMCPLAQEIFATTRDVHLVLRHLPEALEDHDTSDGRPATIACAVARLGRMVCADSSEFDEADAILLAKHAARRQVERLAACVRKVIFTLPEPARVVLLSGHGEFVARPALEALHMPLTIRSLVDELGPELSRAAPAYAVAVLAEEANA